MKNPAKASDLSLIEPVINKYKNTVGSLITVLQEIQDIYGYLPEDALCHAAIGLGIAPATVFGVATFYAQFRFTPVGRYFIMLCQGTACHVNGSEMIEKAVFETLGIHNGETTSDGLFTLKTVACLGCCSLSPVMMINSETYGSLTPQRIKEIIAEKAKEASTDVKLKSEKAAAASRQEPERYISCSMKKATGIIRFTRSDASGCAFSSPLSIYMMAIRSQQGSLK